MDASGPKLTPGFALDTQNGGSSGPPVQENRGPG